MSTAKFCTRVFPRPISRASTPSTSASVAASRSSSPMADTIDDSWLDELLWDSTTVSLNLAPIPTKSHSDREPNATSPPAGDGDDHDLDWKFPVPSSRPQKRKYPESVPDRNSPDDDFEVPPAKKAKPGSDKKSKETSNRKSDDEVELRRLASAPNKHITAMKRDMRHTPIPKMVHTPFEHDEEVKRLAKKHVRHVAPVITANSQTGRDLGGTLNKFDRQKARREIKDQEVREPSQKLENWVDKDDETITWLSVPASNKYINTGKKMIPVADIISKSPKFPEFTFVEETMGIHSRTKKEVVKAYMFKYEKLDDEQALLRAEVMMRQAKQEAKQRKKDGDARRQAEVRKKRREQQKRSSGGRGGRAS